MAYLSGTPMQGLEKRIKEKKAVIGIIGLGYVGLPLACLFANKGYDVIGADIKTEAVEKINQGISPISEPGIDELLSKVTPDNKLKATTDTGSVVRNSDILFVVVQTPIKENKVPDLNAFKSAYETISENLTDRKRKLIISESTIPPGTMKNVAVPLLEKSGLKAGADFYLAYSPERAIPTKTLEEIQKNGRIVGGLNEESAYLAALLYRQITSGEVSTDSIETAEMVKVVENAFRDVNIAFANEIALLCEKMGVDASKVIKFANKHPRVNILEPGPGVGGHCIPKDPYLLIHAAKAAGFELNLISQARRINEAMPTHVLKLIERSLKDVNQDLRTAKVAILGIAYKGNTDDSRNSPAEPIVRSLMDSKCDVISHDPYAKHDFGGRFSNDLIEVVKGSDCLVFIADHDVYRKLDLQGIKSAVNKPCVLLDTRRLFEAQNVMDAGMGYAALGTAR